MKGHDITPRLYATDAELRFSHADRYVMNMPLAAYIRFRFAGRHMFDTITLAMMLLRRCR